MMRETTINNTSPAFVFVACGAVENISELNYAVLALQKFSSLQIFVITDLSRNTSLIEHNQVIDVATPVELDNHQASIWLKTSIHKHLPTSGLYCYLDTDVIALSSDANSIFDHFQAPIVFAHDHCQMDTFSPYAVNCSCISKFDAWQNELLGLFKKYHHLEREREDEIQKTLLLERFAAIKKNKLHYLWLTVRFWLAPIKFNLDNTFFFYKKQGRWTDSNGKTVLYEKEDKAILKIEATTDYRCNTTQKHKWTRDGIAVFDCKCNHLKEQLKATFDIAIESNNWHHWNGGVFLFNAQSHTFLDMWHERTNHIFTLPEWKTRDQGTLIATVFSQGLSDHATLPLKYNLITNDKVQHHGNLSFSTELESVPITPHLIHMYHHWGNSSWDVWNAVEKKTSLFLPEERDFINALWIGDTLSSIELLTIHSYLRNGHTFRLWVYEPIKTALPHGIILAHASDIIPKSAVFAYKNTNTFGHGKGSYAGFSDIFRYKLLYEKGGWWTDMDVTCLKPVFTDKPYFFRPHHVLPVVGNVMKCPIKSPLMLQCHKKALAEVTDENTDWHKPIQILNDHILDLGLTAYISTDVSNPDQWDVTSRFLWTDEPVPENWLFIHWQNEEWRTKKVNRTSFYHRAFLTHQLAKYELYTMPKSSYKRLLNAIKHNSWVRKLLS